MVSPPPGGRAARHPSPPDPPYRLVCEGAGTDVVLARVEGELDYVVTPALRRRLFDHLDTGLRLLVLDLAGVRLLSAAAMEMLLGLDVMGAARDCELRVVASTRAVRRPLGLTGLDARLRLFDTLEDALTG